MKIAICGDIHMCKQSSLVNKSGTKYTQRLENCLKSINWFEKLAKEKGCGEEIYLGDFFNTSTLDEQTITALKDIEWNDIPKYMIVGNHDSDSGDLRYNAVKALEQPGIHVIDQPTVLHNFNTDDAKSLQVLLLPYIREVDKKASVLEYFDKPSTHHIVFSHNDLKGVQLGPVMSMAGYDIEDINKNIDLFINGHLHNGAKISDHCINLGILTGANFGEDATRYSHNIMILDTETLKYELIENPYAFNFYKFDILEAADLNKLDTIKNQAVLSIRCAEELIPDLKAKLASIKDKIAVDKVNTIVKIAGDGSEVDISELVMDHIAKFCECCREKLEASDILEAELAEICK